MLVQQAVSSLPFCRLYHCNHSIPVQPSPEEASCIAKIAEVGLDVAKYLEKLAPLERQLEDVEQGHLPEENHASALKQLRKQVRGANEMQVQCLERLDAVPVHAEMVDARAKRKHLIQRIEGYLATGDGLIERIGAAISKLEDS
eukprot:m.109508 g.109508  ORF g.109508 m.109508 type:complete len:144 (+) comp15346_c0_seq3:316-747(+)